ncbi:MAG: preprotein translocase subunit SecE [Acidimicrobiia bacterium]
MAMNRQTKRLMQRQGADQKAAPDRRAPRPAPQAQPKRERTSPGQYISEVRGELRKVAWPTRREVINSTLVVLICVTVMTSLIFGFDYLSARFVLFLFD